MERKVNMKSSKKIALTSRHPIGHCRPAGTDQALAGCRRYLGLVLLLAFFPLFSGMTAEPGAGKVVQNAAFFTDGALTSANKIRLCDLVETLRTDYGRNSPRALNKVRQMIQMDPDNALNYYLAAAVSAVQQDWVRMAKYLQVGKSHPTGYYYVLGAGVDRYLRLESQRRFAMLALQNLAWKANEGDIETINDARAMALKVMTFTPRSGLAFGREWKILNLADDGLVEFYQMKKDRTQELSWATRRETDQKWATEIKQRMTAAVKQWPAGGVVTEAAMAQLEAFLAKPPSASDRTTYNPVADALFTFDRDTGEKQMSPAPQ